MENNLIGDPKEPNRWRISHSSTSDVWVTYKGRPINIVDMSNYHLVNTIRVLHRRAFFFLRRYVRYYGTLSKRYKSGERKINFLQKLEYWKGLDVRALLLEYEPSYRMMFNEVYKRNLEFNVDEHIKEVNDVWKKQ